MPIHQNVLSLIGQTPLVRLDKTAQQEGLKCNLFAKCEYFSAGGSVKVRLSPTSPRLPPPSPPRSLVEQARRPDATDQSHRQD